jgi:predicted O-linked N-acetylglucosamine transferase (SPINDLY family)
MVQANAQVIVYNVSLRLMRRQHGRREFCLEIPWRRMVVSKRSGKRRCANGGSARRSAAATGSGRASALHRRGGALVRSERWRQAVAVLSQAAGLCPDSPAILEDLALAYRGAGQIVPALRVYDRLIGLGAATVETWRATGDALCDVGEYAQAVDAYEHSLALSPESPERQHDYGRALFKLGEADEAARRIERAARCSDSIVPWASLATMIPGVPSASNADILSVRREFAQRLAAAGQGSRSSARRRHSTGSRIRIGYVSASERFVALPLSYLTFEVTYPVPEVAHAPCVHNRYVTFGSLVSQYKLTVPVVEAWSRILGAVPTSRLVLANRALESACNREHLLARFETCGIARDRLELLGPADHAEFLRYYDRIDVALDAFPYNGGTTTMEAIWQGVPVLTFNGDRWASRTSQTLLYRAGLGDWVMSSVDTYVDRAIALARDRAEWGMLADIRGSMREQVKQSSACDVTRLARCMERVFLLLHRLGE